MLFVSAVGVANGSFLTPLSTKKAVFAANGSNCLPLATLGPFYYLERYVGKEVKSLFSLNNLFQLWLGDFVLADDADEVVGRVGAFDALR